VGPLRIVADSRAHLTLNPISILGISIVTVARWKRDINEPSNLALEKLRRQAEISGARL